MQNFFWRLSRFNPRMGTYIAVAYDWQTRNANIKTSTGSIIILVGDYMNSKISNERLKEIASTFKPD
ncbi:MAG: hypothetical protein J0I41_23495 [Filimonas sp.]|nr:hypothetical protein [Filimonas sp.]